MNIQNAVKKAVKKSAGIRRRRWFWIAPDWHIVPTNSLPCIVIKDKNTQKTMPYWNPTAEDLIADDWELVEEE